MRREKKKGGEKRQEKSGLCSWRPRRCTTERLQKVRRRWLVSAVFAETALLDAKKTTEEKEEEQDAEILAAIASRRKLASDLELAKGVQYTEPMKTSCVTETSIDLDRH